MFRLRVPTRVSLSRIRTMSKFEEVDSIPSNPSWSIKEIGIATENSKIHEESIPMHAIERLGWLTHLRTNNSKDGIDRKLVDTHALISSANIMKNIPDLDKDPDSFQVKLKSADSLKAPMRSDEVTEGNDPESVLSNAVGRNGLFFSVPKVINQVPSAT